MRVCVPTTDDSGLSAPRSDHFGRAPYYTIVDTETDDVDTIPNRSSHRGGSALPPDYVAEHDVDAVLVDHVGKRGMKRFDAHGIDVYQTPSGTVEDLVSLFEAGDVTEFGLEDAHGHGHGHDHDHEHGHGHGDGHDH